MYVMLLILGTMPIPYLEGVVPPEELSFATHQYVLEQDLGRFASMDACMKRALSVAADITDTVTPAEGWTFWKTGYEWSDDEGRIRLLCLEHAR